MCATPMACSCSSRVPDALAAITMKALCSACGLRVNCTADASARCSRRRETAACNSRPANAPALPARNTPNAMSLMRAALFAAAALVHEAPREIGDHAQTEDPRGQAHVDLHVAVEDVTELVTDHRLQLIAVERIERALRHRHGRLVGRVARRERVDAWLVGQHEDLRLADARRDGHLLDDVHEALSLDVAIVAVDLHAAQRARHRGTAFAHLRASVPRRDQHRAERDDGDPHHHGGLMTPVPRPDWRRGRR